MKPWYRQFWPWFLIALPASSVVAGLTTLVIALEHADSVVREDWYQRGQNINEELALDDVAASRRISALLSVARDGAITVELDAPEGSRPERLELELHHPTDAARDLRATLRSDRGGRFEGTLAGAGPSAAGAGDQLVSDGSWDVSLQPPHPQWRLQSRVSLPAAGVRLRAGS